MSEVQYYEVEGAVFRKAPGRAMELYMQRGGGWETYRGDVFRITRLSNALTLDEVRPYMDDGGPTPEVEAASLNGNAL